MKTIQFRTTFTSHSQTKIEPQYPQTNSLVIKLSVFPGTCIKSILLEYSLTPALWRPTWNNFQSNRADSVPRSTDVTAQSRFMENGVINNCVQPWECELFALHKQDFAFPHQHKTATCCRCETVETVLMLITLWLRFVIRFIYFDKHGDVALQKQPVYI